MVGLFQAHTVDCGARIAPCEVGSVVGAKGVGQKAGLAGAVIGGGAASH